jgi:hypothetical protein
MPIEKYRVVTLAFRRQENDVSTLAQKAYARVPLKFLFLSLNGSKGVGE